MRSHSCSRDFHLTDLELINLILSSVPNQVPNGSKLWNLPQEIVSWLTSLLQSQPQKMEWNQLPTQSKLLLGPGFNHTLNPSQSQTPISTVLQVSKKSKFWELLPPPLGTADSAKTKKITSKSKSIRTTIDCVAQTYRLAGRQDPRLDSDGKPSFLFLRQIRGYKKLDPLEKQQVALTGSIIRELPKTACTSLGKAMCELFTGTFFFAMRSRK
jgi:hypothetical protein